MCELECNRELLTVVQMSPCLHSSYRMTVLIFTVNIH